MKISIRSTILRATLIVPKEKFAIVRAGEADTLKALSPAACKLLVAIKIDNKGGENDAGFDCGVRDFEAWGLTRSVASRAMKELIDVGLLAVITESRFDQTRSRRKIRVASRRKKAAHQSRSRDEPPSHSPASGTQRGSSVRPAGQKGRLQSHQRDIPKDASRPSASKPEGREASRKPERRPPQVAENGDPPERRLTDQQREALREEARRRERAARACDLGILDWLHATGGPRSAKFLEMKFDRGDLTVEQLKKQITVIRNQSATISSSRDLLYPPHRKTMVR